MNSGVVFSPILNVFSYEQAKKLEIIVDFNVLAS